VVVKRKVEASSVENCRRQKEGIDSRQISNKERESQGFMKGPNMFMSTGL